MNKFELFIVGIMENIFSDLFQSKAIILVFSLLGCAALIGSFWNLWQLVFAAMCLIMVFIGIDGLNKSRNNERRKTNTD